MSGRFRFAVDLGTSNTVAVVDRGDGRPRPLLFDGNPLLPSAVFADVSGTLFVGRDAERHMMTDASRFEPNPKGRVDDGVLLLGDREVPVTELFAAILRRASAEAAQTGVPVAGATVLTCPVDWGTGRRRLLLEAAERAGLGTVTLLDEPVSAATYCVRALDGRLAPGRCVVVFDFGGGTLDVTVVEAGAPSGQYGLRVLATGGLDDLGGTDIDDALVGHLGQMIAAADPQLWRRLAQPGTVAEFRDRRMFWSEVRAAKEMLSRASTAPIHVPGRDQATHLTREELDRIAGPLVDRAVDETRRVLQRSGAADRLDAIVLVGGSSRLPLVASRLHARFGLAPVVPEQPELPVAFGALLLANGAAEPTPAPPQAAAAYAQSPAVAAPPAAFAAPPAVPTPPGAPVSPYAPTPVSPYPGQPTGGVAAAPTSGYPAPHPSAYQPAPTSGGFPAQPTSGGFPAQPTSGGFPAAAAYPVAPVSAHPAGGAYPGQPGAYAGQPSGYQPPAPPPQEPQQPPRRPSVVIGPGVTIQGNVAVYGDSDLMPKYARDDDDDDEPPAAPAKPERAPRSGGGALRRLRFLALPVLPWVLIMTLTPWGRGLFNDGKAKVEELLGNGPAPSASASAPASPEASPAPPSPTGPTAHLDPSSGKAGTQVKVTGAHFAPREKVEIRAGTTLLFTATAGADGAFTATVTPAKTGAKAGPLTVKLTGKTSKQEITAEFVVKTA
ncbi:Hsp70 family protein [Dactylosporangium sp. AC04546]|uniref:Hsp70 family protein n=1 Tax=Dactylosporangium sp. AC04546 TaxID=2862460 RepID=UPI002E7B3F90|nr:Hsp70 family protein [Dactylosporangium sp. AC04546]WVK86253.1 Hsp70 family protein [Dactylosporangium sp. AC04546]